MKLMPTCTTEASSPWPAESPIDTENVVAAETGPLAILSKPLRAR